MIFKKISFQKAKQRLFIMVTNCSSSHLRQIKFPKLSLQNKIASLLLQTKSVETQKDMHHTIFGHSWEKNTLIGKKGVMTASHKL